MDSAVGAIILKVTYGYQIETADRDPLVKEIEETLELFMAALAPATWLVDIFPSREHSFLFFLL